MQVKVHRETAPSAEPDAVPRTPTRTVPTTREDVTLLRADLLIPGRGEPLPNAALVISRDKIAWVGPAQELPERYGSVPCTRVRVLMPGMWDCHVHLMGAGVSGAPSQPSPYLPGYNALAGAITVDDLRRTLMAGITSVRDLGGFGCDVWPGVRSGQLTGPNIYGAVAALSITGGHGDDHAQPIDTVLAGARCHMTVGLCNGVDDCTRVVRTVIRRGARVIKVCSSGGVLSLNDDPEDRQFSDAELRAIVDEAARSRRAVAAHAIGKAGIMAALRVGARSIEHGMFLDEAADLMRDTGAVLVPTQHVLRMMRRHHWDDLPEPSRAKLLRVAAAAESAYKVALRKGVRMAMGTDTMSSDPQDPLAHGNNAQELVYAVELGMTALQAVEMATANGPETLGCMAPLSGQLKEGYDADVLALDASPLEDIAVLTDRRHITHIWKGGKIHKSPSSS